MNSADPVDERIMLFRVWDVSSRHDAPLKSTTGGLSRAGARGPRRRWREPPSGAARVRSAPALRASGTGRVARPLRAARSVGSLAHNAHYAPPPSAPPSLGLRPVHNRGLCKPGPTGTSKGHRPEDSAHAPDPTPTATQCAASCRSHVPLKSRTRTRACERPHLRARAAARVLASRLKSAHHGLEPQSMTSPEKSTRLRERAPPLCPVPAYDGVLKGSFHAGRPHRAGGRAQSLRVRGGRSGQLLGSVWVMSTAGRRRRTAV